LKLLGNFIQNLEIDLNQKSIDFYEFESHSVKNIKNLILKKSEFSFEKLVELFIDIENLTVFT